MGQDLLNFRRWNRIVGWGVFAIAALTYLLTIEPSSSLWDCGEFIATSYKLEVGHPPGAPLYMLLARIATLFAPSPEYVPHMVNGMNALASAFCILFMFWTVTHIARRLITRNGGLLNRANTIATLGAGAVGALAYTFTDTFWFSAVEGEVYALSSMFTALVVWLMLRWEEEADDPHSARWIILIAYLMGLSIGVHILNLLTIPALVFIYYFRKYSKVTIPGMAVATLVAGALLYLVNGIIIPYTVYVGAKFDVLFVNGWSWPVNSGMIVFVFALFALLGTAIYVTHRMGKRILNLLVVCVTMIMLGFSSYASVTIRASVNPPMNSNNPDNPTSLLSMLNREQYGKQPLLYGPSYVAPVKFNEKDEPMEKRKTVYNYNPESRKYEPHQELEDYEYADKFMHFFPRMWHWAAKDGYNDWATENVGEKYGQDVAYAYPNGRVETIHEPRFQDNLHFFFSYQMGHMYWRYFMWNFVGRQNDIQGEGNNLLYGNWISGIDAIDSAFLGPQENLPREMAENKARNVYYFLPFLLGLLGLIYQLYRDPRNFIVVMWLFVMMGVALVVYFNITPGQPRERDYIYAGSFYAFSMWIGLGVLALYHLFSWLCKKYRTAAATAAVAVSMVVPGILCAENWDDHDRSHRTIARDIGYNYLSSVVEKEGVSPIIVNYGDNDTFPLWFNQEVDGVRPDVRIMNSSYLDGAWYVDEMKCKANAADGIPFSLPRDKYAHTNDFIEINKDTFAIDAKTVMAFVRSDYSCSKIEYAYELNLPKNRGPKKWLKGNVIDAEKIVNNFRKPRSTSKEKSWTDYIPTSHIILPVDKKAVLASGIVAEKDRDLIEDSIVINIKKSSLSRSQLMVLDMLAHFDWKRPIYFTHGLSDAVITFGLQDYLQFDGYAYRLVPIKTEFEDRNNVGRIDAEYAYDKLMNVFRYGNLADSRVYVDEFIQNSINAARAREAFARVAKEYIKIAKDEERLSKERISRDECYIRAEKLLDRGLTVLPINQIRFTEANTYPFIECYYELASAVEKIGNKEAQTRIAKKGNALLKAYSTNLMEYVDYCKQFKGEQGYAVVGVIYDNMKSLSKLHKLATKQKKPKEQIKPEEQEVQNELIGIVNSINDHYRCLSKDKQLEGNLAAYCDAAVGVITAHKELKSDYENDVVYKKLDDLGNIGEVAAQCGYLDVLARVVDTFLKVGWDSEVYSMLSSAAQNIQKEIGVQLSQKSSKQRDNAIIQQMKKMYALYELAHELRCGEVAYNINDYYQSTLIYLYDKGDITIADELAVDQIEDLVNRIEEQLSKADSEERNAIIEDQMDKLYTIYVLAYESKRDNIVRYINKYYRSLGAEDKDLLLTQQEREELGI